MSLALAVGIGVVVSLAITPVVARFAASWRLFDLPGGRRIHVRPIPRLGGVAIFIALLAGIAAHSAHRLVTDQPLAHQPAVFVGILLGGMFIFSAGLWDDLKPLSPLTKFNIQCVVAAVVFAFGIRAEVVSFGPLGTVEVGWLSLPVTIIWIVGITNAVNLIDGLDGLATGLSLVAAIALAVMAGATGRADELAIAAVLCGTLVGFLVFNLHPARIFLGDSGSYLIGFLLATLTLRGSFTVGGTTALPVPLLILALPILDVVLAITRRWMRGVPLFAPDANHIHHRLLTLGLSHRGAVLTMQCAALVLAAIGLLIALYPSPFPHAVSLGSGLALVAGLVYGIHRLRYREFQEAWAVLRSVTFRGVRVVRFRIRIQDLGQRVAQAASVSQARAILSENAANFGFLAIEFARENELSDPVVFGPRGQAIVQVSFPVEPSGSKLDPPYILRSRYQCGNGVQPGEVTWAAQTLGRGLGRVLTEAPPTSAWDCREGLAASRSGGDHERRRRAGGISAGI